MARRRAYGPGLSAGGRNMGRLPAPAFNPKLPDEGGADLISASFQARGLIRLVEQYTNRFRSQRFYDALREANAKAATAVQKGMYDELHRQIGTHSTYAGPRPQRDNDRLGQAIMDERNAVVYPNAFQVGVEAWLNKSPAALYWRSIEEGMAGYWTRALFKDPGGKFASPGDGGPHMRMIQFDTAAQRSAAGKTTSGGRVRGAEIHVRPIHAFHYSAGGQRALRRLDMEALYVRYLGRAGFPITAANKSQFFK